MGIEISINRGERNFFERVFTVIFYSEQEHKEFIEMVEMLNRKEKQIAVEKKGMHSYLVRAILGSEQCWDIVMHKYMNRSRPEIRGGRKVEPTVGFFMGREISQKEA